MHILTLWFVGATVLDPKPGFYNKKPVVTNDFASLYPSIMMAMNLCYCTYVRPGTHVPPHVTTRAFEMVDGTVHTFVTDKSFKGVVPELLHDLLTARRETKKIMKKLAADDPMKQLLDGRQLAQKVSCNSVYGFTGANTGMYPLKVIAEVTTLTGRGMINRTKEIMETQFGAEVIYGDTDSVMVIFPQVTEGRSEDQLIREAFELGEQACDAATVDFGNCNKLECEKVQLPYMLFAKKKYCARVFETPDSKPKLDAKGLAVVRRDTCDFVARVMRDTLDALMMKRSPEKARDVVAVALAQLAENRVPIEELTLSKRLAGSYKSNHQPHLMVVEKMEQRQRGSAPRSGDRVPFVLVEVQNPQAKVYEKAEDPEHVKTNALKIDRLHYLTNGLKKPVSELFSCFDSSPEQMFDLAIQELTRQRMGQTTLTAAVPLSFDFAREVKQPEQQGTRKRQCALISWVKTAGAQTDNKSKKVANSTQSRKQRQQTSLVAFN